MQVSGDVGRLAAILEKPLRPIWLSQESRMWLNEMADQAYLPITPLYLVSASIPHPQRQSIGTWPAPHSLNPCLRVSIMHIKCHLKLSIAS